MEEIIEDRLYRFKVRKKNVNSSEANIYFLKKEQILIDAGYESYDDYIRLNKELSNIGFHIEQIQAIIITHHHSDHIGMLQYFPRYIPIIAHPDLNYYISSRNNGDIKNSIPDLGLSTEEEMQIKKHLISFDLSKLGVIKSIQDFRGFRMKNISIFELSGHSSTDIGIILEDLKIAFTGDFLLEKIFFDSIVDIDPRTGQLNRKLKIKFKKNLLMMRKQGFNFLAPGHGDLITTKKNLIDMKLKRLSKYCNRATHLLNTPLELNQIAKKILPGFEKYSLFLQFSEVYLLLELLIQQNKIEKVGGVFKIREQSS
ncbi:MBL fold metallo-hydrolase [Listeria aquatica]|uniref:MBL fold metallo-hydrolase n=1 Tax=Listeria aquatica TaxID=1494960 RepID=UPI003F70D7AC